METLRFVGPATKFHLARNIGLDYAKPDLQLLRVAKEFGYGGSHDAVFRMVDTIQRATRERPGVIDYILWEYQRRPGRPRDPKTPRRTRATWMGGRKHRPRP